MTSLNQWTPSSTRDGPDRDREPHADAGQRRLGTRGATAPEHERARRVRRRRARGVTARERRIESGEEAELRAGPADQALDRLVTNDWPPMTTTRKGTTRSVRFRTHSAAVTTQPGHHERQSPAEVGDPRDHADRRTQSPRRRPTVRSTGRAAPPTVRPDLEDENAEQHDDDEPDAQEQPGTDLWVEATPSEGGRHRSPRSMPFSIARAAGRTARGDAGSRTGTRSDATATAVPHTNAATSRTTSGIIGCSVIGYRNVYRWAATVKPLYVATRLEDAVASGGTAGASSGALRSKARIATDPRDLIAAPHGWSEHLGERLSGLHPILACALVVAVGFVVLAAIVVWFGFLLTDVLLRGDLQRWDSTPCARSPMVAPRSTRRRSPARTSRSSRPCSRSAA